LAALPVTWDQCPVHLLRDYGGGLRLCAIFVPHNLVLAELHAAKVAGDKAAAVAATLA
jgi:hypothetical protein